MSKSVPRRKFLDPGLLIIVALGLAGAVVTYRAEGIVGVLRVAGADSLLFLTILPKVAAGCLIGALITLLVPSQAVVKLAGAESGLRGLLVATLAGILIPGGPFTVFPIAVAFLAIGADRGAAVAFVTAWHVIGLNRAIIWEMPFFGHEFVFARMAVSLAFPVIVGLIARIIPWPGGKPA